MSHAHTDQSLDPGADNKITTRETSGILVASVITAVASLGITVLTARLLAVEANAEFLVFWSLFFGLVGLVSGMQTEATRAASAAPRRPAPQPQGAPLRSASLILGSIVAIALVASSSWWLGGFLNHAHKGLSVMIAVGILASAGHFTTLGAMAGHKRWSTYSRLLSLEAAARPVLVTLAALIFSGAIFPVEVAVIAPAVIWVGFILLTKDGRQAWRARADVPLPRLLRNLSMVMVSSTATSILLTGFPAILRATDRDADPALVAGTILAITLTRAPIMMPLIALQSVAINRFTEERGQRIRSLLMPMVGVLMLGVVGSMLAGLAGPWLIRTVYGDAYQVAPMTLTMLTLAAVGMGWMMLTGSAALAVNAHTSYVAGWVLAAVCAAAITGIPMPLATKAIVALTAGPLVGTVTHLIGFLRGRRHLSFDGVDS